MLKAESLVLGPVTLQGVSADVKVSPTEAELTSVEARVLGGQIHITGKNRERSAPLAYSLEGQFQRVNPAELCRLLGLKCTGAQFAGDGKIQLAGYADHDLSSSAKGALHFEWKKGGVAARDASADEVPSALARFDSWTGDAEIASGAVTLGENHAKLGARRGSAKAIITFGEPPKVSFGTPKSPAPQEK